MGKRLIASVFAAMLAAPALAAEISIATIGPITGHYQAFGAQLKAGAEQAVTDINAAGGVNGKQLKLIVEDDACDPSQAVAMARKLVAAKVALVAGHFCSGSSIPAAKVYADAGIVQISPASTNPRLTDERAGPNVFRVAGRDDRQGQVAGTYMADKFKGKKIAILHDNTPYGKGLADETRRAMNKAGLKEAMQETYIPGAPDYKELVAQLKAAAIDVAYVGGYHTEAALIVREMRAQEMTTQLISGEALVTKEFWQVTGEAGEGTLMTFSPDPRKNPAAKDVVARFRARQIEPEGYVLYTYAAIQAWAQAAGAAGSEASDQVVAKLNGMAFATVLGKFKFDEKGDPDLPAYTFYQWKAGSYDQLN